MGRWLTRKLWQIDRVGVIVRHCHRFMVRWTHPTENPDP